MVDAQLPIPADAMPRSRSLKPEIASGRDAATGNDFFSAVSAERDNGRTEEAGNASDLLVDVVSLDPSLDGEEAVAALTQAVAAFFAADLARRNPDGANAAAGDAAGGIGHADPAARMRAALPGLATIASNALDVSDPHKGGKAKPVIASAGASAQDARVAAEEVAVQPGETGRSLDAAPDVVPTSPVSSPFRPGSALLQSTSTAISAALAQPVPSPKSIPSPVRATASDATDEEPEPADQPQQAPSGQMARIPDPLRGTFPAGAVAPNAVEAAAVLSRQLAGPSADDGTVGEPGLSAAPVETGNGSRLLLQPAFVQERQVPQTVSGAQLPEVPAEAAELSRQADEKAAPSVRPSRQPSEVGLQLLSAMKPGEAMQAPASGPALPGTPAAIIFAQLPGIAGAPAPSTAESLRPLSPTSADFSTGAPLRHLEIVLAPPELGTVRVVITREDGEMQVEMIASTSQAVDMLEAARESLVEAIRETGMRAGSIEIRQDLNAARPSASGDLANGSAWHGRQEQGRHQGTDNWQSGRAQSYAQSYAQAGRVPEGGAQNRGLIL